MCSIQECERPSTRAAEAQDKLRARRKESAKEKKTRLRQPENQMMLMVLKPKANQIPAVVPSSALMMTVEVWPKVKESKRIFLVLTGKQSPLHLHIWRR